MEYKVEVLLKKDSEWYWLGPHVGPAENYMNILGVFNLTKNKTEAVRLYNPNINNWMPTPQSWIEPIEALRRHSLESNYWVEFRRNPHKLALGIEEFIILNKVEINGI